MDPTLLIPAPDPLPIAWWWFEGLNLVTFVLHIIMVNILLGSGMLAVYLYFTERANPLIGAVSNKLPTMFALTVNFGVAPLLFLQVVYGQFFYTSATMSAVWWLAVILLLIFGYYALYYHQYLQRRPPLPGPMFLVVALVCVLLISLVLTTVLTTMENPELWDKYFANRSGTVLNFFESTTIPRYLHFLMASIAMGGLVAGLMGEYQRGVRGDDAVMTKELGMKVFATVTMLQMASGLWWLMALDRPVMHQFMGDNTFATALLGLSVALTFPALAAGFSGKPKAAAVWTLLVILTMAAVRALIRLITLEPFFSPSTLPVSGEVSPFILFLVSLVIGLTVIGYMLKLGFAPSKEG